MSQPVPEQIKNLIKSLEQLADSSSKLYQILYRLPASGGHIYASIVCDDLVCEEYEFINIMTYSAMIDDLLQKIAHYAIGIGSILKFGLTDSGIFETNLRIKLLRFQGGSTFFDADSTISLQWLIDLQCHDELETLTSVAFDSNPSPSPADDDPNVSISRDMPTFSDLYTAAEISEKTMGRIRIAAGIAGLPGGAGASKRFTPDEVTILCTTVLDGSYQKRRRIATSWAKWCFGPVS